MMRITRCVQAMGIAVLALAGCSGGVVGGDGAPSGGGASQALAAGAQKLGRPPAPTGKTPFVEFESGPVRPIALSSDGSKLFVTNIPDNRLEIFDVDGDGLHHA